MRLSVIVLVALLAGMLATSAFALPIHSFGDGTAPTNDFIYSVGSGDKHDLIYAFARSGGADVTFGACFASGQYGKPFHGPLGPRDS